MVRNRAQCLQRFWTQSSCRPLLEVRSADSKVADAMIEAQETGVFLFHVEDLVCLQVLTPKGRRFSTRFTRVLVFYGVLRVPELESVFSNIIQ